MGIMRRKTTGMPLILVLFLFSTCVVLSSAAEEEQEAQEKCRSAEASQSCGQCIKQHPDCAWCADPRLNVSRRCDVKTAFDSVCSPNQMFAPTTEIKVAPQHNLPLGGKRTDSPSPIQLEPQQVEIRMKPGDIVEVPFRYLHKIPSTGYEVKDFTIQTSEFRSLGLEIEFSVDCNGERQSGRVCPGVKPDQKIGFYAKVSLKDCSNTNLIAVSVGIYGYNTVSAIFVTPLCGCECENPRLQEKRSPRCGYKGNLVCGVCQCDQGKGGEACECDLNAYGVSSPDDLLNQCREHRTSSVCSGKGKCSCGKCTCDADYIKGKYCECDSGSCPLSVDGRLCSGRGECDCGKCVCEQGYGGDDCSCSNDPAPCTENGVVCNGNGYCECGKCSCNVGWTGATCNVAQSLPKEEEMSGENKEEDNKEDTATSANSSSSEEEEGEEPLQDQPDTTGDLLPASGSQSQVTGAEDDTTNDSTTPDSASTHKSFTYFFYLANTLVALAIGLYVL